MKSKSNLNKNNVIIRPQGARSKGESHHIFTKSDTWIKHGHQSLLQPTDTSNGKQKEKKGRWTQTQQKHAHADMCKRYVSIAHIALDHFLIASIPFHYNYRLAVFLPMRLVVKQISRRIHW